jgi:hypothetical protein
MTFQEYLLTVTKIYEELNFPNNCKFSCSEHPERFEIRIFYSSDRNSFSDFVTWLSSDNEKIHIEYSFTGYGGTNLSEESFNRSDDLIKIQKNCIFLARAAKSLATLVKL